MEMCCMLNILPCKNERPVKMLHMKRNRIIYYGSCCVLLSIFSVNVVAQKIKYSDGRPDASLRAECRDEGIVMR
jgi:hypothetical protein